MPSRGKMFYDNIAFPWLLFSEEGTLLSRGTGSLFALPPAADSEKQVDLYRKIRSTGWHKCLVGYDIYSRAIETTDYVSGQTGILILPGLKVRGGLRVNEKPQSFSIFCDKADVVRHVDAVLMARDNIVKRFDEITRQNVHEIRGINSGIYHAAAELKSQLTWSDKHPLALAGNIEAFSQILSARIDFMNFLFNDGWADFNYAKMAVFRKFDRMCRCFKPKAGKQNIEIDIYGQSIRNVFGPKNMMDLVSYLLLDNAVKYSPKGGSIGVSVEDDGNHIVAAINSVGPVILEEEAERIFSEHYRGLAAQQSGVAGSGIGLYAVKQVVEVGLGGSVKCVPGKHLFDKDGTSYHQVRFELRLPSAD